MSKKVDIREFTAYNAQLIGAFVQAIKSFDIFTNSGPGCPTKFTWISGVYRKAPDVPTDERWCVKLEGTPGLLDRAEIFLRGMRLGIKLNK